MRDAREWDEVYVLNVPPGEHDWVEFKRADLLDLKLPKVEETAVRNEMSKQISAFANSGGGTLVYGIRDAEVGGERRVDAHGGVSLDVKNGIKEWLEDIIPNLVQFPLTKFNVYIIRKTDSTSAIAEGKGLILVDVPSSETAPHQASDNKYYARVAGKSRPLGHQMVLDIIGRSKHPKLELTFSVEAVTRYPSSDMLGFSGAKAKTAYILKIRARNKGRVYARFVNAFILIPSFLVPQLDVDVRSVHGDLVERDGRTLCQYYQDNTARDIVEFGFAGMSKKGPARYAPILPELSRIWEIDLHEEFDTRRLSEEDFQIEWSAFADNASEETGAVAIKDIDMVDRRSGTGRASDSSLILPPSEQSP